MSQFNIAEAKSRLSALVQRAMMGEEVVIARDNKPVARIVPLREERRHRRPGTARGEVWIAPDFDETPDDFKDYI
jgi:prevent-host-death family protein